MRKSSRSDSSFSCQSSRSTSPQSPVRCVARKKPGSWPERASASRAPGVAHILQSGNLGLLTCVVVMVLLLLGSISLYTAHLGFTHPALKLLQGQAETRVPRLRSHKRWQPERSHRRTLSPSDLRIPHPPGQLPDCRAQCGCLTLKSKHLAAVTQPA